MADLNQLESKIKSQLKKTKLGDALNALYLEKQQSTKMNPFMIAGLALFITRFCSPSKVSQKIKPYKIKDFRYLIHLSNLYLLSDPITIDEKLEEDFNKQNPVFMRLRIASSQFPFEPSIFGDFARPFYLYHEIPKQLSGLDNIPEFDFESRFRDITGVSVLDFITIGYILFAASSRHFTFSRSYFKKCRQYGFNLPNDQAIRSILNHMSADKSKLVKLYKQRKNQDRRFRAYDFNPLLEYPLIKPCQRKQIAKAEENFYHAPVPELIASKIGTGIFYQMFNEYGTKFSKYFGFVFEKYVGIVLENCINSNQLLSESDIRSFYPQNKGKSPDWIILRDSTAILFECKATRFSLAAKATATEDSIKSSLSQVQKGLKQLYEFISACKNKVPELEKFHHCDKFIPIFVSMEPMHLINSSFFREYINNLLALQNISEFNWKILAINQLEAFQPHLSDEISLEQVLEDLEHKTFNDVLGNLVSKTKKSFGDSFLSSKQDEIFRRLSILDRWNQEKNTIKQ